MWLMSYVSYCTIMTFPGFGRLVLGLSSDFRIIVTYTSFYFIIKGSTWTFWVFKMEPFVAVVNDINMVTIVIDSSFLGF